MPTGTGQTPALVERTAYLLGAVAEAAAVVVIAVNRFQGFVADQQRTATSGGKHLRSRCLPAKLNLPR
jgi:hypothetical protein